MKFKKFLKPTKAKVILSIIIFLILPVMMWNGILPERCLPEDVTCIPVDVWIFKPLILQFDIIKYNLNSYALQFIIINLAVSYLLSCLIISIYGKIKNKVKK